MASPAEATLTDLRARIIFASGYRYVVVVEQCKMYTENATRERPNLIDSELAGEKYPHVP